MYFTWIRFFLGKVTHSATTSNKNENSIQTFVNWTTVYDDDRLRQMFFCYENSNFELNFVGNAFWFAGISLGNKHALHSMGIHICDILCECVKTFGLTFTAF